MLCHTYLQKMYSIVQVTSKIFLLKNTGMLNSGRLLAHHTRGERKDGGGERSKFKKVNAV